MLLLGIGDSISEGIGQGRITGNMAHNNFKPDLAYEIPDLEALPVLYDLIEKEGLAFHFIINPT
jgi:cysteine synthase A